MKLRAIDLKRLGLQISAAAIAIALANSAEATTSRVNSHASDIQVTLDIASVLSGTLGPYTFASGYANNVQPTYSDSETFLSAAASGQATVIGNPGVLLGTGLGLTSQTLNSSASGGFLATGGEMTTASSSIEDLALGLKLAGLSVITIGGANSDITSTSTASEDTPGSMGATLTGSSQITGVTLDVLGQTIDLSAYANAAPNTVVPISGIVGLVITINQQTVTQGVGFSSIETNALNIDFTDLHLAGIPLSDVVSGDIIIGQSFAEVPEPAAWIEMLVGVGGLGVAFRARRSRRFAAA
jgi:hypothetical protein